MQKDRPERYHPWISLTLRLQRLGIIIMVGSRSRAGFYQMLSQHTGPTEIQRTHALYFLLVTVGGLTVRDCQPGS
jgi:hypothetical protein